jgi:hypothetical protein
MLEHIMAGRDKDAIGMLLESGGINAEEEFAKPETQKFLSDLEAFRTEMGKQPEDRDMSKLQGAIDNMRGASQDLQESVRTLLRLQGIPEDQVKELLPTVPVAPTGEEGGEEGRDITAPTGDEQRTPEQEEFEAAVKPFVQNLEERIRQGNFIGGEEDLNALMRFLKETDWKNVAKKTGLYGWRTTYITVLVLVLTYVALMAKTNAIAGKK